ncbi:GAF domain-containing protein [Phormidium tenue FACHB-886]|nr:GAF domain-containing protein [Phormidium tenue FACHB-886]
MTNSNSQNQPEANQTQQKDASSYLRNIRARISQGNTKSGNTNSGNTNSGNSILLPIEGATATEISTIQEADQDWQAAGSQLQNSIFLNPNHKDFSTSLQNDLKNGSKTNNGMEDGNGTAEILTPLVKDQLSCQWLLATTQQIQQATTLNSLLNLTVIEIQQQIKADRVLIYRFQSEDRGKVLAEALNYGYTPALGEALPAIAFGFEQPDQRQPNYRQILTLNDSSGASLTPYQHQLLERFQVKASLSIPIVIGQVWGLLVVQQCSQPRQWAEEEIALLYQLTSELKLSLQALEFRNEQQAMTQIYDQIREMLSGVSYIQNACETVIQNIRQLLDVERVCIYKFHPDYSGEFIYESEAGGFPSLVGSAWVDTYLQENQGGRFRYSQPIAVDDIYQANLSACHIKKLEHFGVRSFVVVAIKQGEKLWGLLSAFQHSGTRRWIEQEVVLLTNLGRQLGTALQGVNHLTQLEEQAVRLASATQISQSITEIIPKILQARDSDTIFRVTQTAVRRLLSCDRVAFYRFRPEDSAELVFEFAARGMEALAEAELETLHSQLGQQAAADLRTALVVNNIYTADLAVDELAQLEQFAVQSYVITPIFKQGELWGWLGIYQSAARAWAEIEVSAIGQICDQVGAAMQQANYLMQMQQQAEQLAKTRERDQFVAKVVERIRQSLDLPQIFKTTAREVRNALGVDRVAIYKFTPGTNFNQGMIVAEDIKPGYISILTVEIDDNCFGDRYAESYKRGRVFAIADIQQAGLNNCYIEMLTQFQVRGNLVVPLFRGEELWGLFCIHQCSAPHDWQDTEIDFAKQIALQLDTAIQQGEYIEQLRQASEQLVSAAEREKAAKERLQQEVIQVLASVRPALDGDLTVRAPVTDDEVGTIADAYNNTLNSLRQIVTQMQVASRQVAHTSEISEAAISSLATQAQHQFQALSQAQAQVETMVHSTEAVGASAHLVEQAVQAANQIVLAGDTAMNRTVEEILDIRETVAETNARLKRLSESSQKISKVVNLISNFTTQTQLLALNASIEATRAGDYGRGFAVVAEEVRSLARQSADAATDIEQLVQDIQRGTAEVSTALEMGIQQVESGTDLVTETRENLNAIVDATAQISQLVVSITQTTEEQTQQFQSVTQTITDVAEIASKTSEDSMSMSASFKELLAMAQTLQVKSDQFKVDTETSHLP